MPARPEVRVLALAGSLRRDSHNRALVAATPALAPAGVVVTVFDRLAEVPLFDADVADGPDQPAGVAALRAAVRDADGLLIATPEYNQAVPGVVKNMIDWLSRSAPGEGLEGLPVAVTGVTTGPWGTRLAQTMLRRMLTSTASLLLPQPTLYLRHAEQLFAGGELIDDTTRERVAALLAAFGDWVRLVAPARVRA